MTHFFCGFKYFHGRLTVLAASMAASDRERKSQIRRIYPWIALRKERIFCNEIERRCRP